MPVLRGAVTFSRFRVEVKDGASFDPKRALARGLRTRAFEPIDRKTEEERAAGFCELELPDGVEFSPGALFSGEHALFGYRIDVLKVPASALKAELDKWAQAFEAEHDRAPGKSEKGAQRALIRQQLRNRATPRTKVHDVSWNLGAGVVQVWAASRGAVDEVQAALEGAFPVTLVALTPSALAQASGVPESALGPTAELLGQEAAEAARASDAEVAAALRSVPAAAGGKTGSGKKGVARGEA